MIDKRIIEKRHCMGCHACESICPTDCISMLPDEEGFLYPLVNYDLCIKCTKCVKVCPIIYKVEVDNNPKAYASINKNEDIRMESSSGGIFSLLAENIINKGGVVFGAGFNEMNVVEHLSVYTIEDLQKLRGSKYVQSNIVTSYIKAEELLEKGREVLFTGTPCQISGLYSYLGKRHENLTTQDIICHGVPSPDILRRYIEFREVESGSAVKEIGFRRKDEGWKKFSMSILFQNNKRYRKNLREDPYMKAFLKDVCLRPSCYDCEFKGVNRQSDVTLADFWGIQNILPNMDDDKGTSLVMVNSEAGEILFNNMKNEMIYQEVDIAEAIKFNSAAIRSPIRNPKRDGFMNERNLMPFNKLVDKYCIETTFVKLKKKIKRVIKKALS